MIDPWRYWRQNGLVSLFLSPFTWLYCGITQVRWVLYRIGILTTHVVPVPVIVVGNVTVGGTGKTPLVAWLCGQLQGAGFSPGIVLRGYGGQGLGVLAVGIDSPVTQVGDEAVLLARRTGVPVVVSRDRVKGAYALIDQKCNVIVADDGLQHYRLARTVEIAVLDGVRRFGNGRCLPSGPLREGLNRWMSVDYRVTQGEAAAGEWSMCLVGETLQAVGRDAKQPIPIGQRVHAVAGIGNPDRFFTTLRALGLQVVPHPFADHHAYRAHDLVFDSGDPVVMTEKDAVKCERFAQPHWWYLPVTAKVDDALATQIMSRLG